MASNLLSPKSAALKKSTKAAKDWERVVEAQALTIEKLRQEKDHIVGQKSAIEAAANDALTMLESRLNDSNVQLRAQAEAIESLLERVQMAEEQAVHFQSEYNTSNSLVATLRSDVSRLEEHSNMLEMALQQARQHAESTELAHVHEIDELQRLLRSRDAQIEQLNGVTSAAVQSERAREQLNHDRLSLAENRLAESERQRAETATLASELQRQCSELQQSLRQRELEMSESLQKAQSEFASRALTTSERHSSELASLQAQLQQANHTHSEWRTKMDTEHASFQAEMQRAADRASTAERALGSEQQKSSHLQQQVAQLLDRVAHSETSLSNLQLQLNECVREKEQVENESRIMRDRHRDELEVHALLLSEQQQQHTLIIQSLHQQIESISIKIQSSFTEEQLHVHLIEAQQRARQEEADAWAAKLQSDLQLARAEAAAAERELVSAEFQTKLDTQRQQWTELLNQSEQRAAAAADAHAERLRSVSSESQTMLSRLGADADERARALSEALQSANSRLVALERDFNAAMSDSEHKTAEIARVQNEHAQTKYELARVRAELTHARTESTKLTSSSQHTHSELHIALSQVNALKTELASLQTQHQQSLTDLNKAQNDANTAQSEASSLKSKLTEVHLALEASSQQASQWQLMSQSQSAQFETDKAALVLRVLAEQEQDKIAAVRAVQAAHAQALDALKVSHLSQLESMKESHEQARLQQQGLLEQQQQLLEQQQKQIQQTQKAIKEQAQKESSKPETIAVEVFQKLQSEHDQSVAQNAECQHELRKLRDEINQLKSTHQAQLQQVREAHAAELSRQRASFDSAAAESEHRWSAAVGQLSQARSELVERERALGVKMDEARSAQLRAALEAEQEHRSALANQAEQYRQQLEQSTAALRRTLENTYRTELATLEVKLSAVEFENKQLKDVSGPTKQQLESQRAVYEQQARLFEQQKSDIQRGYQSQIDELTRQLHDITNQKSIQAVQAQATVMPAPMPAQPPVYPDQQRLVDELRQQVNDKQRQLDEQLSKMQTLTQNLMTAQNEFAKLSETHQVLLLERGDLARRVTETESLQQQLSQAIARSNELMALHTSTQTSAPAVPLLVRQRTLERSMLQLPPTPSAQRNQHQLAALSDSEHARVHLFNEHYQQQHNSQTTVTHQTHVAELTIDEAEEESIHESEVEKAVLMMLQRMCEQLVDRPQFVTQLQHVANVVKQIMKTRAAMRVASDKARRLCLSGQCGAQQQSTTTTTTTSMSEQSQAHQHASMYAATQSKQLDVQHVNNNVTPLKSIEQKAELHSETPDRSLNTAKLLAERYRLERDEARANVLQAHDQLVELQRDVARLQMLNNEWEHREAVHTQTRKQLSEAQQALTEMSLRHDTLLHQHRFELSSAQQAATVQLHSDHAKLMQKNAKLLTLLRSVNVELSALRSAHAQLRTDTTHQLTMCQRSLHSTVESHVRDLCALVDKQHVRINELTLATKTLHELRDTDGAELQQLRVQASRADHLERTCEVYETELQVANTQIQTLKAKLQQYKDQALAMPVQSQQQSLSTSQLHSRSISTATHQPLETSMPLFGTPARQSAQFNTPIASTMSNLSHSSHAVTSSVSSTPSRRDIVLKELLDMRASALDERQRAIMQGRRPTPEMENMLISVESALAKLNS